MSNDAVQRGSLRLAGLFGGALFSFFFVLTFSTPQWVEKFAVEFIEARVNEKVESSLEGLLPPSGESIAALITENLYRHKEATIEQLKQQFKDGVRETWVAALAEVRDLNCACREKVLNLLESGTVLRPQSLEALEKRLTLLIQASYMDVATDLKRDIRIFAAANAGAFFLLVLISFLKPQAVRHLFVPGLLLCAATLVCAYGYVFEQNWLLTLINGSYLGFAYATYLGVVFLLLCDVVLNRGRITTRLANGLVHGVGGTLSLIPC